MTAVEPEAPPSLAAEEAGVEAKSASLKKELGLRDLVLQQIVYVVGTIWVGTAAKLGHSQLVFWLAAMLFFYLPQAAVVIASRRSGCRSRAGSINGRVSDSASWRVSWWRGISGCTRWC